MPSMVKAGVQDHHVEFPTACTRSFLLLALLILRDLIKVIQSSPTSSGYRCQCHQDAGHTTPPHFPRQKKHLYIANKIFLKMLPTVTKFVTLCKFVSKFFTTTTNTTLRLHTHTRFYHSLQRLT